MWLWYLAGSPRLASGIKRLIDQSVGKCWLSPISVWETALLASKGRLRLGKPVREWLSEAKGRFSVQEAPITGEIALLSLEIDLPHPDPADRFIAATALAFDLTLVTADQRLIRAKTVRTRSR